MPRGGFRIVAANLVGPGRGVGQALAGLEQLADQGARGRRLSAPRPSCSPRDARPDPTPRPEDTPARTRPNTARPTANDRRRPRKGNGKSLLDIPIPRGVERGSPRLGNRREATGLCYFEASRRARQPDSQEGNVFDGRCRPLTPLALAAAERSSSGAAIKSSRSRTAPSGCTRVARSRPPSPLSTKGFGRRPITLGCCCARFTTKSSFDEEPTPARYSSAFSSSTRDISRRTRSTSS